jgi:MFS family permease
MGPALSPQAGRGKSDAIAPARQGDDPIKGLPIHYGWVILAAGTLGSFMTLPGQTAGVSVFFHPITQELGISRTWASAAYSVGTLAGILPAPIVGRWIDKRGPRVAASLIAVALALACAYMALVRSELMLLIGFALLRGTAISGLSLVSGHVVNLWFVQRRGIAAAAASLGVAAGSMVFPPLIDLLIAQHGWRGAYVALSLLIAVTILPVAALLFRGRPELFGLRPDAGMEPVAGRALEEPSFTRKQALGTRAFWLLSTMGFLTNAIGTALLLNHFSIMQSAGIERGAALVLLSALAAIQVAATLGTGVLVDRYEPRRLVPLSMAALTVASLMPVVESGVAVSWIYALCVGAPMARSRPSRPRATRSISGATILERFAAARRCSV